MKAEEEMYLLINKGKSHYYFILLLFALLFVWTGCGTTQLSYEKMSPSISVDSSAENSSILQTVMVGEIQELKEESMIFQTEKEDRYEIPFDAFPVEVLLPDFQIGDVLKVVLSDSDFFSKDSFLNKIVSYTIQYNTIHKKATKLLQQLSLEEKVGQMFLIRIPDEGKKETAKNYNIGGYIWFAKDFSEKNTATLQEEIQLIQEAVDHKLFMAVDEEGGEVTRISSFKEFRSEPFPSPRLEYQKGSWKEVQKTEKEKAELLKYLGINLNLAPVADVSSEESDFIFSRSFSTDPLEVAEYVETVVKLFNQTGVGTVLKHFPGYGSNVDTHTGVAYDQRDINIFRERDFVPFKAGVKARTEAILISHNVIEKIDDENPASLSVPVHKILRDELNFSGLILTDDLVMDGLRNFSEPEEAAILAVLADNDILISTEFSTQIPAVIEAVKSGRIPRNQIDQSVRRILEAKIRLGIIE